MKLIVHIGAGKTGSSSIQDALLGSESALLQKGIFYTGLMMDKAPRLEGCEWQFHGGSDIFFDNEDREHKTEQMHTILSREVDRARENGIHTIIWSNEWLFGRHTTVFPALAKLAKAHSDLKIEVLCYVRRHDKWARSAYTQWGMKHKTYPGKIRGFHEWIKGRNFAYTDSIKPWIERFPRAVEIANYDATLNIVEDFFKRIDVDQPSLRKSNIAPRNSILAVWAVFNNRFTKPMHPSVFIEMLKRNNSQKLDDFIMPPLSELIPSHRDLTELRHSYEEDITQLNEWLVECGQPELDFSTPPSSDTSTDLWELNQITLSLLFQAIERIDALEKKNSEK
jgi:hypothetical protein